MEETEEVEEVEQQEEVKARPRRFGPPSRPPVFRPVFRQERFNQRGPPMPQRPPIEEIGNCPVCGGRIVKERTRDRWNTISDYYCENCKVVYHESIEG